MYNNLSIIPSYYHLSKWKVRNESSLGDFISFDFSYLPNEWFIKTHKEITNECMQINKPSLMTLYRYNYSLKHFFNFLNEHNIVISTYNDLTYKITQQFLFYLKNNEKSKSTNNVIMSSLKWVINHGQHFDYEGFPQSIIFDGDEYKVNKVADSLKTKYIPDNIMNQIETALKNEDNIYIKSLMEIIIDTGLRLSEALDLTLENIVEDLTGKPILFVESMKNNTERYIPVSRRVIRALKNVAKQDKEGMKILDTEKVFIVPRKIYSNKENNKRYRRIIQKDARRLLFKFVFYHNITNNDESLYALNFHSFRHTLGTDMLNRGMSMFEIRDYLGHKSLHSTSGYAKLKNPTIQKEYKRLGFVGMIVEDISKSSMGVDQSVDNKTVSSAALPDGACSKPINNQGNICAKFNMCIICPKFITTPSHLPIHQDHLNRLTEDEKEYMASEYIGTIDHLESVKFALKTIIVRLEEMQNGNK